MIKKKKHHKKKGRNGRRNAAGAVVAAPRRRMSLPRINRAPPPDMKTLAAAVAASVGSSVASALVVNQKIAEPETAAMLMTAIGGVGAYFTGGNLRVACTGIAAAGAGQYALAKIAKSAIKSQGQAQNQNAPQQRQQQLAQAQPQLSAPPPPPPPSGASQRPQSATGGGVVVELFRDAAADLELLDEDEWRYGMRDAEGDDFVEIDLDEAA